jgi:hypothetical protein
MTLLTTPTYLAGGHKLPAGAVPLATDQPGSVICQTPPGRWIRWWPGTRSIESVPPETQIGVVNALVERFGTKGALAEALQVSPRTVDAYRRNQAVITVKTAEEIARMLQAG